MAGEIESKPREDSAALDRRTLLSLPVLSTLFAVELLALIVLRLPLIMSFDSFAFCDSGSDLTLDHLVSTGLKPAVDFGYHYGLLPIVIGRLWLSIFGATPAAYQAAMALCDVLIALAIAQIVIALRLDVVALTIVILALGFAVEPTYPHFAQAIEAVLLCHALAQHARGARENALALSCAAILVKPSMGFVYSALLTMIIARRLYMARASLSAWMQSFAPAAIVLAVLCPALALRLGVPALVRTVFPFGGYANYRAMNYGFFGAGRAFWNPSGRPWLYYLVDFSGFWLAGSAFLFASALFACVKSLRSPMNDAALRARFELLITCAVLHATFVMVFFGNRWSWIYYAYLLVIGVAIATDLGLVWRRAGYALAALALSSWTAPAFAAHKLWAANARSQVTAGLWASAAERDEWARVLSLAAPGKTAILDITGAAELMFPEFAQPVSLYLEPGLMVPAEVKRKLAQLAEADTIVVPIGGPPCRMIPRAPEFTSALAHFTRLWRGNFFEMYRRQTQSGIEYPSTLPQVEEALPVDTAISRLHLTSLKCGG